MGLFNFSKIKDMVYVDDGRGPYGDDFGSNNAEEAR